MMDTAQTIRLRLRFYKDVTASTEELRQKFETFTAQKSEDFKVKICDNHIWMFVSGNKKKYWSPHLHLELEPKENHTHIRGLFGPDQTLWTLFVFLHFIVAGIFTVFGAMLYSNLRLKQPYQLDLLVMFLMVVVWFLLYFIARQIRFNGTGQMDELEALFLKIIE